MKSDGFWCPILFREYEGVMRAYTTRGETLARPEGREVDYTVSTDADSPYFHTIYIETCYIQLRRH